ncbi:MAG: hypothetical protein HGA44_12160 [Cellulomonadaceae bacterium]|nr:hypothetical protein [Cellulomonadaceae bacterium]
MASPFDRRALPPADPWVTRRNVLIYASIGLQCVAFGIYVAVRFEGLAVTLLVHHHGADGLGRTWLPRS